MIPGDYINNKQY